MLFRDRCINCNAKKREENKKRDLLRVSDHNNKVMTNFILSLLSGSCSQAGYRGLARRLTLLAKW